MSDKDFDRIFSKGLEEGQKYPYDEQDWEKLSERLDEHNKSIVAPTTPTTSMPLWKKYSWLGLLLLLLIGSHAALFMKMSAAETKNNTLINELNNLKSLIKDESQQLKQQSNIQRDTIIIYKYLSSPSSSTQKGLNTIFSNSSIIPTSVNPYTTSNTNLIIQNSVNQTSLPNNTLKNQSTLTNTDLSEVNSFNKYDSLSNKNWDKSTLKTPYLETLTPLRNEKVLTPLSMSTEKALPYLNNIVKIVKTTPNNKRFYVGISGGLINYHTEWLNKDNVNIYRNEKSYQVGMKFEYAIADRWRVIAGSDYCPFSFKIYWQDSRYNLPAAPEYFVNSPDYKLKTSEASQQLLQGYIGIKHLFSTTRWRPFVSMSYTSMRILPFETKYTFTKLSLNKEVSTKVQQKQISVSNLGQLTGGFEYRFNNRLLTQAEAFYYKDLNKTKKTYDLFGARMSFLFGF